MIKATCDICGKAVSVDENYHPHYSRIVGSRLAVCYFCADEAESDVAEIRKKFQAMEYEAIATYLDGMKSLKRTLDKILGLYERFKNLDGILSMDSDDPFRRFAKEAWQAIKAQGRETEEEE